MSMGIRLVWLGQPETGNIGQTIFRLPQLYRQPETAFPL